ncbi:hypothetical protein ABMY12_20685 [Vibrio vulnificus]|uniref:hypothetical protein n=1 Tax=Vibrio vulnificus TaxID=672 RepID=UPI0040583895
MSNQSERKSAVTVQVVDGKVSIIYEAKTPENIAKRLFQAKQELGVTWYGVASLLGLEPTENNVRLLSRWQRDSSARSAREMPENAWKNLLMLLEGQAPLLTDA